MRESESSAGFQSASMDRVKEFAAGLFELIRRLIVADLMSEFVEYFKAGAGFQIIFRVRQ